MPGIYGSAPNWARYANGVPSMLGVIGTLGTADTSGTALTVPIGVDPLTGAQYVSIIGTTANGTSQIAIQGGTSQTSYPSFSYYSAAATTTIKSGTGILHTVIVGSLLGGGTLYNSAGTSASIIWSSITPSIASYTFDLAFGSLTFAGTGAGNVTIVYA